MLEVNERLPFVWKTGNSGENSNGTVHPFSGKKSNTFRRYYLFPIFTETSEIFCTFSLFGLLVPGFMSKESEKFTGIL